MFLSRQVLSTRLQPGNYPAIIIGEVVELLAALDEVGIPVHEEYIWLHFVETFPQVTSLSKEQPARVEETLTRVVLEDALRSKYNVQSSVKKGRMVLDTALSCQARRLAGELVAAEVALERTKASWAEGVKVRAFIAGDINLLSLPKVRAYST